MQALTLLPFSKPSPPQAPTRGLGRLQPELLLPPLKCESWQSVALPRPPMRARAWRTRPRETRGRGVASEGKRRRASDLTRSLPTREGEDPLPSPTRRSRGAGAQVERALPGAFLRGWEAYGPAVPAAGHDVCRLNERPAGVGAPRPGFGQASRCLCVGLARRRARK